MTAIQWRGLGQIDGECCTWGTGQYGGTAEGQGVYKNGQCVLLYAGQSCTQNGKTITSPSFPGLPPTATPVTTYCDPGPCSSPVAPIPYLGTSTPATLAAQTLGATNLTPQPNYAPWLIGGAALLLVVLMAVYR